MDILPFGPWEPDAPHYGGQHAISAKNVIPAKLGYRSFKGISELDISALPARVLAACSRKDMLDDLETFAATAGGIYKLSNKIWTAWHTGTADDCDFAFYGANVYALFGGVLLKGGDAAFSAVSGAPNAGILGIIRDFMFLGQLSDKKNAVRWSAMDNPDNWPEPGSNAAQDVQSDIQIFPEGGKVISVTGGVGGADGLIFLENAIQRATYSGPPYFFQFDVVSRGTGCIASRSPVVCENVCVFLASDGWYLTDGAQVRAIGAERVDAWFFHECASARCGEVRGVWDADNRVALWSFPSANCPQDRHDRMLIYNAMVDRWSWAEIDTENIFSDYMRGYSLEDLNALGSLDGLTVYSLDSASLRNGTLLVSAFSTGHKLGNFKGSTLEAAVDTAESGGERAILHGFRPLVDQGAALSMPIWRDRQSQQPQFGSYSAQSRDGVCYQHVSANYFRARVKVPAGTGWETATGVEMLAEKEGGM